MWLVTEGSRLPSHWTACPPAVSFRIQVLVNEHSEVDILWTIFVVLLILWLLGFSLHVGGGLIHLLLVVGLVVLVINLLSGRRSAV
jgi:hypothetical protein